MPCNLILAFINSCLVLGYLCVTGLGDHALTFPLGCQKPEVRAAASIAHPQLVIRSLSSVFIFTLCHPYCSSLHQQPHLMHEQQRLEIQTYSDFISPQPQKP